MNSQDSRVGDHWDGQAAGEDSLPQTLNLGCRSGEGKLDFRTKLDFREARLQNPKLWGFR